MSTTFPESLVIIRQVSSPLGHENLSNLGGGLPISIGRLPICENRPPKHQNPQLHRAIISSSDGVRQ